MLEEDIVVATKRTVFTTLDFDHYGMSKGKRGRDDQDMSGKRGSINSRRTGHHNEAKGSRDRAVEILFRMTIGSIRGSHCHLRSPALLCLGYKPNNLRNPRRVLVGFNESHNNSLGEIVLLVSVDPVTALVPLTVIDESSSFNVILGRA